MKIKHWAGYGSITATKVADKTCTLHIHLEGNHEQGLERDNLYDLYKWLVQRFDKSLKDVSELDWERNTKRMTKYGYEDYESPTYTYECNWDSVRKVDTCDYKFWY